MDCDFDFPSTLEDIAGEENMAIIYSTNPRKVQTEKYSYPVQYPCEFQNDSPVEQEKTQSNENSKPLPKAK